jgi:hypothetical protein
MTHDEVVAEIQARAKRRGILTHYCGRAQHCKGDRGSPDLVLVGPYHTGWIEVKMPGDTRKPEQTTWFHALRAGGQLYEQMGPADLDRSPLHSVADAFLDYLAGF